MKTLSAVLFGYGLAWLVANVLDARELLERGTAQDGPRERGPFEAPDALSR